MKTTGKVLSSKITRLGSKGTPALQIRFAYQDKNGKIEEVTSTIWLSTKSINAGFITKQLSTLGFDRKTGDSFSDFQKGKFDKTKCEIDIYDDDNGYEKADIVINENLDDVAVDTLDRCLDHFIENKSGSAIVKGKPDEEGVPVSEVVEDDDEIPF